MRVLLQFILTIILVILCGLIGGLLPVLFIMTLPLEGDPNAGMANFGLIALAAGIMNIGFVIGIAGGVYLRYKIGKDTKKLAIFSLLALILCLLLGIVINSIDARQHTFQGYKYGV